MPKDIIEKMAIERISLLRNVGQFDNVSSGAQVPLTPFAVIYAENGRGKMNRPGFTGE